MARWQSVRRKVRTDGTPKPGQRSPRTAGCPDGQAQARRKRGGRSGPSVRKTGGGTTSAAAMPIGAESGATKAWIVGSAAGLQHDEQALQVDLSAS